MRAPEYLIDLCMDEWRASRQEGRDPTAIIVSRAERRALVIHFWASFIGKRGEATDEAIEALLNSGQSRVFNTPLLEA